MNPLSEETETQMTKQTLTESEVQQEIQDFNLQIRKSLLIVQSKKWKTPTLRRKLSNKWI